MGLPSKLRKPSEFTTEKMGNYLWSCFESNDECMLAMAIIQHMLDRGNSWVSFSFEEISKEQRLHKSIEPLLHKMTHERLLYKVGDKFAVTELFIKRLD